uniref:Uncharacterized protein n=1 Tax=Setaria viridis TaxID=4556 RepID=A0A4U6UTX8_SETVI|nr:hypothetical protein SEVIR_4G061301v2 [Setaria viridis]
MLQRESHGFSREKPRWERSAPLSPHHHTIRQQRRDRPGPHVEHAAVAEGIRLPVPNVIVAHEVDAVLPSSALGSREGHGRLRGHEERLVASQIIDPPPLAHHQVGLKDFEREGAAVLHPLLLRQGGQASDQPPYLQKLAAGFNEVAPVRADITLASNGAARGPWIVDSAGYAFHGWD